MKAPTSQNLSNGCHLCIFWRLKLMELRSLAFNGYYHLKIGNKSLSLNKSLILLMIKYKQSKRYSLFKVTASVKDSISNHKTIWTFT